MNLNSLMRRAESLCRERGVRLTTQRRQILELVCASPRPLGAYEILEQLRAVLPNPTPPTVYRALDFLLAQGLVHKLESLHAYVGCTHPEHPHAAQFLICAACGEVQHFADEQFERDLEAAEAAAGFAAERRVVELIGTCAACQKLKH